MKRLPLCFDAVADVMACYHALNKQLHLFPLYSENEENSVALKLLEEFSKDVATFPVRWFLEIVNSTGQMKPPSNEILGEFYSYELNLLSKNRVAKLVVSREMEKRMQTESKQTLAQSLSLFLEKYRAFFKHFQARFSKVLSFIGSDILYETLGLDVYSLVPTYPIDVFKEKAAITGFPTYFKSYGLYENLGLLSAIQSTILEKFPFPDSDLKTYPLTLSLTNNSVGTNTSFVDILTRAIRSELEKGNILEARRLGGMIPAWFPYALLANMELIYCEEYTELLEYPMKVFPRFKKDFEIIRVISPDEPITCLYNNSIPALLEKHHKLSVAQMVNYDNDKYYLISEETRDIDFDFLKAFHIFRLMFGIAEYPLEKFNAGIAIITRLLDGMTNAETRKCVVVDMFSCLFLKKNAKEFLFSTIQARIMIELLNKYDASDYIAKANDLMAVTYQMDKIPQFGVFLIKDPIFILQALAANDWKLADHLALMLPSYRRDLNLKMMVNNLVTYNIQPTEQQDMVYAEACLCYPELHHKFTMIETADPAIWELIDARKSINEELLLVPLLPAGDLSKYKMHTRFSTLMAEYMECNGSYEFNVPTAMLRAIRNDKVDVIFKWLRSMNVDPYEYLFSNASKIDLGTLSKSFKEEYLSEYQLEMRAYEMSRKEKYKENRNHDDAAIKELIDAVRADTLTTELIDDLVYQIDPRRIVKELLIVKDEIWNDSVQQLVDIVEYAADSLEKEQLRRYHKGNEYKGDGSNRERFAQGLSKLTKDDILRIKKDSITEELKRQLMAFVTDSYDLVLVKRVCELLDVNVSPVIEHKFNDYVKKISVKDKASEYQTYVHLYRFTKYLSDPKKAEALCEFFLEGVFTRYSYEYSLVGAKSIPRAIIGICFQFDLPFTAYKISEAYNLDYRQYALNIIYQEVKLGFYEDARANFNAFRQQFKDTYVEDYKPFDSSLMEDKSSGPQSSMLKKKENTSEPSVVSNFMVRKQMLDGIMIGQTNAIRRPSVPKRISSLILYDDFPSSLPDRPTSFCGHNRTFVCPFSDWTSVPFFEPFVRKSLWNTSVIKELQGLDFSRKKFLHMSKDSQVLKMKELKYYTVHCTSTYVALPILTSLQLFDVAYQMLLNISESSTQEYSFVHYFFLPSIAFRGQHAMKKFIISQDQLLLLTGSLWTALETYCYEHKMHNTLLSIYAFKNQLDDAAYIALSLYKKSNISISKRITHLGDAFNHLQESIEYRTNQSQSAIPPIVLSDATTEEIQQMADRVLIQLDFCQMCMLEHIEITPSMDIVYNDANGAELAAYALTRNKLHLIETMRAKIPIDMQRVVNRAIELIADHKVPEIQKLMELVKTHYGEYYDNFFRHSLNTFAVRRNIKEIVALILDTFTDPSEIAVWFLEHDFLIESAQYATDAKNTSLMPLIAKRATELGLKTPVNLIMKYLSRK